MVELTATHQQWLVYLLEAAVFAAILIGFRDLLGALGAVVALHLGLWWAGLHPHEH